MLRGVRMRPLSAQLNMLVSPVNFQLSGNRTLPFITRKMQGVRGAQAVSEPAGRVGLIWMESPLCRLPSARSRGSPGGQLGPGPSLRATYPGSVTPSSEAVQLLG